MSSRESILRDVRAARPPAVGLPDVRQAVRAFTSPPGDPVARFLEAAAAAGASVLRGERARLPEIVALAFPAATRVLSLVPGVPGTVSPSPAPHGAADLDPSGTVSASPDPHELADLDLLVCEAVLGVAENGAVWLPESRVGTRAALFLPAQVAVVLEQAAIVPDLHEAYARIDPAAEGFAAFVAGPSKTADIEQSLVVGAHGPRALTIILLA